MNKYSLTASILSFILAVSALPAGAAANEVRPRAALDSVETTVIEEPAENEETGDAEEIEYSVEDSVETADSESEETLEAADSEPEDTMTPEVSGSEEDTDAGEETRLMYFDLKAFK